MGLTKSFFSLILIILISGCGLSTMTSKYDTANFTVTPPIMQVHAGNVTLNIDGNFTEKYFAKRATVSFTPVIVYDGGETAFKTITIQGEEAEGGEATVFYESGGGFSYQDAIPYNDAMLNSKLELRAIGTLKSPTSLMQDEEKSFPNIFLADGTIATSQRVQNVEEIAVSNHGYEKETILSETATIYFLVNQSSIRTTEKSDKDIQRIKDFAKQGNKTHSVEIKSYASPEGSIDVNDNVSDRRMESTVKYTKWLMKKVGLDDAKNNNLYVENSFGEDWEGFNRLMRVSDIKDKRRITKIVNSVEDLEKREQEIRDMAELYEAIEKDVLPQLRKAQITVRTFESKRTENEISSLAINNPIELDIKELLYAATLTNDREMKENIFISAAEIHKDWRGYNNIGCLYLSEGNLIEASNYFSKAEDLGGNQNDINVNKGIIASWKGELLEAEKLFEKGNASEYNQAILNIRKGDYKKAARFFKGKNSHNAALSQILNGNNNVNCTDNTAACYYLNAIVGARKSNESLLINNLKKAVEIDSSYKLEALNDLEFIHYRQNEIFQSIIK